jgi:hypothetical protein
MPPLYQFGMVPDRGPRVGMFSPDENGIDLKVILTRPALAAGLFLAQRAMKNPAGLGRGFGSHCAR